MSQPFLTELRIVFRAQSNNCDGGFLLKQLNVLVRKLFSKKGQSRMLDWTLNMPLELHHFECSNSNLFLKMIKVFEVSTISF